MAAEAEGELATFAAGCFWGTEYFFKRRFKSAFTFCRVGYMGGPSRGTAPTYPEVKTGTTGLAEVLQVRYDPSKVSYDQLLGFFFQMHNPTELNHQGHDKGTQYRTAIFYHNDAQKAAAERHIHQLNTDEALQEKWKAAFGHDRTIVTRLEPASTFFDAEEYHQDYLNINPDGECNHRIYWSSD